MTLRLLRIYSMAGLTAVTFIGVNWTQFDKAPDIDTLLSSLLLLPSETPPVPVVLWTLKQELLFYAIFAFP